MELQVLEQKKNKLVVDIVGEGHTFCNALRDALWQDSDVKTAGYNIEHPQKGVPRLVVETKGKEAKQALVDVIKRLQKQNDSFFKAFNKM